MVDGDLAAEVERLKAQQAETNQAVVELATALQTVAKHLSKSPTIGPFERNDLGSLDWTLRALVERIQKQGRSE